MKARELAELLLRAPDADVVMMSALTRHSKPIPFEIVNISMNNEANAWIIFPPLNNQIESVLIQT